MSVAISAASQAQLEQHARQKDRRERLWGRPPARVVTPKETKRGEATKPEATAEERPAPAGGSKTRRDFLFLRDWSDAKIDDIFHFIEVKHGIRKWEILSVRRHFAVTEARREAMAMVYKSHPRWSLCQIGRLFNRDHTSVLQALRKSGVYVDLVNSKVEWHTHALELSAKGLNSTEISYKLGISRQAIISLLTRHKAAALRALPK